VRYFMTEATVLAERVDGDTVRVRRLFDEARGCDTFAQRILSFGPGRSRPTPTRRSTSSTARAR